MILLLVMLSLLSGGSTEVVQDFKEKCGQFFFNRVTPTVLNGTQYRQICQTLYNTHHFATLYDTNNKIPVYSAYVIKGWMACERLNTWYIEPQLENNNEDKNMRLQGLLVLKKQASDEDYVRSGFDRGHLAPVFHANSQKFSDATFTLTNAAPQYRSFNRGQWRMVEYYMLLNVNKQCEASTAHIVTGVVPGNYIINNSVRVPSYFWTAYCCKDPIQNKLISGGVIGVNSDDNFTPYQMPVKDLEAQLKNLYNVKSFSLFDNNCRDADYVRLTNTKIPLDREDLTDFSFLD